jgi:hypothetical protein
LKESPLKTETQKWLTGLFQDQTVKILAKNSNLTKTQLETILIDILAERISEKRIVYEDKAKLRLLKSGVSRGAFNRTLAQSRKNIIRSIYTLILLGYLGILEDPRLEPYIEIANKIRTYTESYKEIWKNKRTSTEHLRVIKMLQEEIEKGLQGLSEPRSLSEKM